MDETFATMLRAGGKSNSLGRANEVIGLVVADRSRLAELYDCLFDDDAWIRMRAADSLEKVGRKHPEWIKPYVDRFLDELGDSQQASIQWHLAQIYAWIELSDEQRLRVIAWLKGLLSSAEIDWIVAANAMDALGRFAQAGFVPVREVLDLINVQQGHKSSAVVKRAQKWLSLLST